MRLTILMIAFVLCSCGNNYENEEDKAIRDIANQYLEQSFLNYFKNPNRTSKVNVDTLDIKMVVSDTLNAFSKISTQRQFLFHNNSYSPDDQAVLKQIVTSPEFMHLKPREADFNALDLMKPFTKADKSQLEANDVYTKMKFSRVCFDEDKKNALVIIDCMVEFNGNNPFKKLRTRGANQKLTLIKKVGDTWKIVE